MIREGVKKVYSPLKAISKIPICAVCDTPIGEGEFVLCNKCDKEAKEAWEGRRSH